MVELKENKVSFHHYLTIAFKYTCISKVILLPFYKRKKSRKEKFKHASAFDNTNNVLESHTLSDFLG